MNILSMLSVSLQCNLCVNYLYIGTMRMKICNQETYLGIKIFMFYLKCTYYKNEICLKTGFKDFDITVNDRETRTISQLKMFHKLKSWWKNEEIIKIRKFNQVFDLRSKREMELM